MFIVWGGPLRVRVVRDSSFLKEARGSPPYQNTDLAILCALYIWRKYKKRLFGAEFDVTIFDSIHTFCPGRRAHFLMV